ncbi:MAG: class I SAM-dependent methyltransferase [Burkholderiales bacterium]|nr:class I SAM-dependent methyltransferase [Burkholderiales bacterium]
MLCRRAALLLLGILVSLSAWAQKPPPKQPNVPPEYERAGGPYVPTPNIVVDRMLALANVGPRDYVMDLGSGDGVIVITAAQKLQASGFGVDIDEELIRLSNERAKKLGIAERVRFEARDIFKTDVSKATVVTLYLLPEFMRKLRPKLYEELRPGTRVVSHDYHFEEWMHDSTVSFDVPEKEFISGVPRATLYLWIVPARVGGQWKMQVDGHGDYELALRQHYQRFQGAATAGGNKTSLQEAQLNGTDIRFVMEQGNRRGLFGGKVEGNRIEGTVTWGDGKTAKWRAVKQPG